METPEKETPQSQSPVDGASSPAADALASGQLAPEASTQAAVPFSDSSAPVDAAASSPKKKLFGRTSKCRAKQDKNQVMRIEELEKRLAEEGIEGVDPETIVSLYFPKRRMQRIGAALLRLDTLQKVLLGLLVVFAIIFGMSFIQEKMGNFTVNLNRLELFRKGISIADNPDFVGATAKLTAEAVDDAMNISVNDLPNGLEYVDGSHNGKNYVAYTFYLRNAGKTDLDYEAVVKVVASAKGAEKAARVKVWRNGLATTYAAAAADGNPEPDTTAFESNDVVCRLTTTEFNVGYVDKYTVVIWLEGDDPECTDEIVGGSVEFSMNFQSVAHEEKSLIQMFIEDIQDTLFFNNPISAAGNDAPDFSSDQGITWDTRKNPNNWMTGQ